MDYYKPKLCITIALGENNRYKIISALYNVSDNVQQSLLWNIQFNRPLSTINLMSEFQLANYLKHFYPYYCEKINAQD